MLDCYDLGAGREADVLFSFPARLLAALAPALAALEERSGITIDPYGTTRLSANHIALLLTLVGERIEARQLRDAEWPALRAFLSGRAALGAGIRLEGD